MIEYGNYEFVRDFICKLFIKRNLEKIRNQLSKE